jgi:hypothetical protein
MDTIPSWVQDIIPTVIIEIIVVVLFAILGWARRRLFLALYRIDPRLISGSFYFLWMLWTIINVIAFINVLIKPLSSSSILILGATLITTSFLLFLFTWREFDQFWKIGIRGADQSIKTGVDYNKALQMCRNSLVFLGTGAAKLSKSDEFEEALIRCRQDRPIKLLLTKPTDNNLASAAQRAGKANDEYKLTVLTSLEKIAQIRERRKINIQVRFYPENPEYQPIFRLMFIDDSICLVSYNIFGDGNGSQLPQLHITRAPELKRVSTSFYYPFELYFNWLWNLSEDWDFKSYIDTK